jgi:hypothetical protein
MGGRKFARLFAVFFTGIFGERGKWIISRIVVWRWFILALVFRWRWWIVLRIVVRGWFIFTLVFRRGKWIVLRIVVREWFILVWVFKWRWGRREPVQPNADWRLRKAA